MNQPIQLKKNRKQLKKKKSQIPFRLNILFIVIFFIFSLLIVQLGIVQILNGEEAQRQINATENTPSEKPVPRGKMYDSNFNVVVDNKPVKAITYTPPKNGESAKKRLELAEKLANFVTVIKDKEELQDKVTERDKKEYYFLLNNEEVQERLTDEESQLEGGELYQAQLDAITEADLETISWTDDLLNMLAIKKELDSAYQLSPHVVVNEGLTDEEYAQVAEHLSELPNIDVVVDWEREYNYDDTFRSFIGNISNSDEGIPRENSEFYLANGYTWNDRVGTSGLEQQYEDVLRGRKEKTQFTTDTQGNVIDSEIVAEGQRGKDLVLTVNMELQKEMDRIVEEELRAAINNSGNNNGYLEDAQAVIMNPQTGEILGMSAVHYDREKKEYSVQGHRTVYDSHMPGSSMKGATVLTGYATGVIDIGTYLDESGIKIAGTKEIKSHAYLGSALNDLQALEKSSNAYMMRIALRLSGASYVRDQPLRNFDFSSFQTMRNHYEQFGLGTKTGIDLPFEASGVIGTNPQAGNLLHLSFGQYDAYTTLQLAQYVSTIANDGYRVRPRLVKEIRDPVSSEGEIGPVVETFEPEVLNKVGVDDKYIKRVQEGFRRVYTSGTAANQWRGFPYPMAGKTGTAENPQYVVQNGKVVRTTMTHNLTLVGYAPYDNPEMAFAVVVPKNGTSSTRNAIHHNIGKRITEAYFDLKNGKQSDKEEDENEEE